MHDEPATNPTATFVESARRTFLGRLTCALGAVAAAVLGIPCVSYFLGSRKPPVQWVTLGPVKDFQVHETRMVTFDNPLRQPWDGMTSQTGVYVRYHGPDLPEPQRFMVLAVNCAHLGCPVSWFPQSGLFMCPCHGGVYYADGARASGPPPRGLFHCVWRIQGEQLEVQAPHYPTLQDTLETKA
jgi:menaquinol-cytochrome c reductase iron-sulfur subunit